MLSRYVSDAEYLRRKTEGGCLRGYKNELLRQSASACLPGGPSQERRDLGGRRSRFLPPVASGAQGRAGFWSLHVSICPARADAERQRCRDGRWPQRSISYLVPFSLLSS